MAEAAPLLGPDDFDAIFNVDDWARVDPIDPEVLDASREGRPLT